MKRYSMMLAVVALLMSGCATSPWKQEQAEIYINIASAYMSSGQYALALKELMEAEKMTPRDPKVHYLLGISYFAKEMHDKAMEEFDIALDLKPDYSDVHSFIGTVHINKSQWDQAIESFNKALANPLYQTPAVALYNMGRAYHGKGNYPEAIKKYQEARNKDPYSVPAYLIAQYTGIAYIALGDMDKAISQLNTSLALAPLFYETHYWLGEAYLKMNRRKEAKSAFQTFLKSSPESELTHKAEKSLKDLSIY